MAIHLCYFEAEDGRLSLPPTDDTPTPPGYIRKEANTLTEVDALQHRLQQATYERCQKELQHDEAAFSVARKDTYDRLYSRMHSAATSEYEREFIKYYLQVRQPERRAEYRKKFACDTAFLELRENDKARNAEELLGESL